MEIKNNSNKLARWAARAILAGASSMVFGFVARNHPENRMNHSILGVSTYRPLDFASQITLQVWLAWDIGGGVGEWNGVYVGGMECGVCGRNECANR